MPGRRQKVTDEEIFAAANAKDSRCGEERYNLMGSYTNLGINTPTWRWAEFLANDNGSRRRTIPHKLIMNV